MRMTSSLLQSTKAMTNQKAKTGENNYSAVQTISNVPTTWNTKTTAVKLTRSMCSDSSQGRMRRTMSWLKSTWRRFVSKGIKNFLSWFLSCWTLTRDDMFCFRFITAAALTPSWPSLSTRFRRVPSVRASVWSHWALARYQHMKRKSIWSESFLFVFL